MSAKDIRNLPSSVLARLLNLAKQTGDNYQVLLAKFVSERFLYRLGRSALRDRFVLKGAMLLRIWSAHPYRATRDLDLLRRGEGGVEAIRADVDAICATKVDPDGIEFDRKSIRLEAIRPEDEYAGTRVTLLARCASARVPLQVDIGVADALWPPAQSRIYPTLLDFAPPEVLTYAPESVIAEKLEAIVALGDRNSRIKDYFDLRYLASRFEFDGATLAESIRRTFQRRRTPIPREEPFGLTTEYWNNPARVTQIRAFARRANLEAGPDVGEEVLGVLRPFLLPILEDLRRGVATAGTWPPGGPWR
jgi:predicted nucleotidyltransferase component of viral defense system